MRVLVLRFLRFTFYTLCCVLYSIFVLVLVSVTYSQTTNEYACTRTVCVPPPSVPVPVRVHAYCTAAYTCFCLRVNTHSVAICTPNPSLKKITLKKIAIFRPFCRRIACGPGCGCFSRAAWRVLACSATSQHPTPAPLVEGAMPRRSLVSLRASAHRAGAARRPCLAVQGQGAMRPR
jgi:hypothetical protein